MKNFSDLLATDLTLEVCVDGVTTQWPLCAAMQFGIDHTVTVDGIEVLPRYSYLADNSQLHISIPFYQWYHAVSDQGWLLKPQ